MVEYDTVVIENSLFDTILLTKDNLTVRVLKVRDSIYISGKCDTIFIEKIIERNIPIKYYKEDSFDWWILYLFGGLIIFAYIWKNIVK
jgi:hypothetical protein|tara:strand:- start:1093 stop:1356 length:264 start_codon:yes stop_codon:yes gene_type:complete